MSNHDDSRIGRDSTQMRCRDLVPLSLWFGIALGIAEGAGFLLILRPTWLPTENALFDVILPQLVMSIAFYTVACLVFGMLLGIPVRLVRWKRWPMVVMGCFVFFAAFTACEFSGWLRLRASFLLALGVAVQTARVYQRRKEGWRQFQRKTLPVLGVVALLVFLVGAAGKPLSERVKRLGLPDAPAGAPNVLLVVWDTVRADRLSAYGYSKPTTPFLESLASGGVLFERAYSASSWTLPSHISLFSNHRPLDHSVRTDWGEIRAADPRFPVLAEVLAKRGYATAGFPGNFAYCSPKQGFGRGFVTYLNPEYRPHLFLKWISWRDRAGTWMRRLGWPEPPAYMSADEVRSNLLNWLDGVKGRPFFAFLNYFEAHPTYFPGEQELKRFAKDPDRVRNRKPLTFWNHDAPLEQEQLDLEQEAYDAAIATLDAKLAQLFDDLRQRGLDKNTIVIVTSDHGTLHGEHDLIGHRNALYYPQVHVPLIVWYPPKVPAGKRVGTPVGNWTTPATVLQLLGLEDGGHGFPGESLADAWLNGDNWDPGPIAVEVDKAGGGPKHWPVRKGWIRSLITRKWQFILGETGDTQLFDLVNDAATKHDLARNPELQPVAEELRRQLEALFRNERASR